MFTVQTEISKRTDHIKLSHAATTRVVQ